MKNEPSYYAVIPADVRYSNIPPNAKLLYGEITALCSKIGYCWATNAYFSELYKVSPKTVSEWVSALKKEGFIDVEIVNLSDRKIYIRGYPKKTVGVPEKDGTPLREKTVHSITSITTEEKKEHKNVPTTRGVVKNKKKLTGLNEIQARNIRDFMGLFKKINPAYIRLYNQQTQREAALRLYPMKGWNEWILFMAAYSVRFKTDIYLPRATTPFVLEAKLGEIEGYGTQLQSKQIKERVKENSRMTPDI